MSPRTDDAGSGAGGVESIASVPMGGTASTCVGEGSQDFHLPAGPTDGRRGVRFVPSSGAPTSNQPAGQPEMFALPIPIYSFIAPVFSPFSTCS